MLDERSITSAVESSERLGSVWESKIIPYGISRAYEERRGAKNRIKSTQELLLFLDLFPRFRKRVEISNRGKRAHILTQNVG